MSNETILNKPASQSIDAPNLELEKFIPYLVQRVAERLLSASHKFVEDKETTPHIWRALVVLWYYGDQNLNSLSHHAAIDATTLSRLITRLKKQRLVNRRRSQQDGREVIISLAPLGGEMLNKMIIQNLEFERALLKDISKSDRANLIALLNQLFENVSKYAD